MKITRCCRIGIIFQNEGGVINFRFRFVIICFSAVMFVVFMAVLSENVPGVFVKYEERIYETKLNSKNKTSDSVRIMCIILTTKYRKHRLDAVNSTWVKRCDKHVFVMAEKSANAAFVRNTSDIVVLNSADSRRLLTLKVKEALRFAYKHYIETFDWVLKADDDTYIIIENLRNLLFEYDPDKPGYLGHLFKVIVKSGYMSGGAGYVISSRGLRHLVERGFHDTACRANAGDEDVEIGKCLQASGVPRLSSLDTEGRQTFFPEKIDEYFPNTFPFWLTRYSWHYPQKGFNCCSEFLISLHHVTDREVYVLEKLLYKTQVYGRSNSVVKGPRWKAGIVSHAEESHIVNINEKDKL